MALKKAKVLSNGITADYWKIINCDVATGQVLIAPFADKEHAENRQNMLEGRTNVNCDFDLLELEKADMNALKFAYQQTKVSKMSVWTERTVDAEYKPVKEEDFVSKELNWFADATDILEVVTKEEE